jgi:hypothetical protein
MRFRGGRWELGQSQAQWLIKGGWSGQRWFISAIMAHGWRGRQLGMATFVVSIGEFNYFELRGGRYKSETQNEKQKRQ